MPEHKNRKAILAASSFAHGIAASAAFLCLPPLFFIIEQSENWSVESLQMAWSLIPLGSFLAAMLVGRVLNTQADQKWLILTTIVTVMSVFIRGLDTNLFVFALSLALFGLGSGALVVILTNRVTTLFSGAFAARAQAIFFSAFSIGGFLGLATAEPLSKVFGDWHAVFLFWAIMSLISLIPSLFYSIRPKITSDSAGIKPKGYSAEVLRYAMSYGLFVGAYFGVSGLLPYQLREWGWSPSLADGVMSSATLTFIIGSFLWASLADRSGRIRLMLILTILAIGLIFLVIPMSSLNGPNALAITLIVSLGVFYGGSSLFFRQAADDPIAGGENSPQTIGIVYSAGYLGGFLVPVLGSFFSGERPVGVIVFFAVCFICASLVLIKSTRRLPTRTY